MRVSSFTHRFPVALLATAALLSTACGEVARTGRSPAYLIISNLEAASGAAPGDFQQTLFSDVVTLVKATVAGQDVMVPTIFGDLGRAEFRVGLKDPGPAASPTIPSNLNAITLTRYRIVFTRSDGRNTQGVDVPYAFDGGMTITVPATGSATGTFQVVRHSAKQEPPLRNMINSGGAQLISTVAEVTFYGRDQAGNDIQAVGTIQVNFGNFADPA